VTVTASLTTAYRNGHKDVICTVSQGTVFLGIAGFKSLAEIEECIDALRQAAKEANLPATRNGDK
jgi:uncharacterized protein CbrC (UPF0167 family)